MSAKDPRGIEPFGPNEEIPSFLSGGGGGKNTGKGAPFVAPPGTEPAATGSRQDVIPDMPKRRSERDDVQPGFIDQFKSPQPPAATTAPAQQRKVRFAEDQPNGILRPSTAAANNGSTTDLLYQYGPWILAAVGILGVYYYYNHYQQQQQWTGTSKKRSSA